MCGVLLFLEGYVSNVHLLMVKRGSVDLNI